MDGRANRGGRWKTTIIAQSHSSIWTGHRWNFHEDRYYLGEIEHSQRMILVQVIVHRNPRGGIDAKVLHERESRSYLHAASQLSFSASPIKDPARIHNSHYLMNLNLARTHVDFNVGESCTPGHGSLIEDVHAKADHPALCQQLASQNFSFFSYANRRTHDQVSLIVKIRRDIIGRITVWNEFSTRSRALSERAEINRSHRPSNRHSSVANFQ